MSRRDSCGSDERTEPGVAYRLRRGVRHISNQHRQLDVMVDSVFDALEAHMPRAAAVAFQRFRDALEAHFSLEESLYFPALGGVVPELRDKLGSFVADHMELRGHLDGVDAALDAGALDRAAQVLEELTRALADHEAQEERTLAHLRPPRR